jgi:hypothetical protein
VCYQLRVAIVGVAFATVAFKMHLIHWRMDPQSCSHSCSRAALRAARLIS